MPSSSIITSQTTMWKRMQNKPGKQQHDRFTLPGGGDHDDGGDTPISPLDSTISYPESNFTKPKPIGSPRDLPPLPFDATEQQTSRQGRYQPASSIYSQHSPGIPSRRYPPPATFEAQAKTYEEEVEISPPSSPETHAKDALPSNNVAVDKMLPTAPMHAVRPSSRQESNIPILRREKRRNQAAAAAAASNLLARKDPGQSTVTSRDQGHPTSVKPGEFTPVVTNLEGAYGPSSAPKVQSSFGDRMRKLKENNKMGGNRPEWKGSSGRMAIVPAPQDDPYVPPLQIPRKSSKRVPSIPSMGSSRVSSPANETPVVSPSGHGRAQYFNGTPISTSRQPTSPAAYDDSTPASPLDSLPSQRNRPVVASPSPTMLPNSVSAIERNFHEALRDVSISTPTISQRPQESPRFSASTYATSPNPSSPRASTAPAPPMPSPGLAAKYASQNGAVSPILNRRRPVGASSYTFDQTTAALRQPPLSGDPKFIGVHRSSLSKALPKSPEEGRAVDKVTALQAQLGDLARQRRNIEASIRRMTELMPGEMMGFVHGMSGEGRQREVGRREEERRKVEALRGDLADVKREEHDVGLKLHRAFKKADERAVYEPTGLWVRRVTG